MLHYCNITVVTPSLVSNLIYLFKSEFGCFQKKNKQITISLGLLDPWVLFFSHPPQEYHGSVIKHFVVLLEQRGTEKTL